VVRGLRSLPAGFVGMTLAHLGMGVFVVGATLSTAYTVEKNLRMAPGDTVELAGYTYRFDGVEPTRGPNYLSRMGTVTVLRDGREVAVLNPEKRRYSSQPENPMTEAAISGGFTRDLYVALGEPLNDGAWAVRVYVKPYVQWLWLGPLLMGIGGLIAASDRRYRMARQAREVRARDDADAGVAAAPAGGRA
jgi:cytochrome c-type biogenesis protein CcmF